MQLTDLVLAPVRVPLRIVQALDDLASIAERARRDPDPVEEVRERIDLLLLELRQVIAEARSVIRTGQQLDITGREIIVGGQDLTATGQVLDGHTRKLIDGGAELTDVSKQIEAHLRVFRSAMPRLMEGLDIVEELEGAVETVAETVEPLQGAAERVGRLTNRVSRSRG